MAEMAASPVVPQSFFKLNKDYFTRNIDTSGIIPRLREKGLLSDADCQSITLRATESEKSAHLCDILSSKDSYAPWILLECLQERSLINCCYQKLADVLRSFLHSYWPDQASRYAVPPQNLASTASTMLCTPSTTYSSVIGHIDSTFRECNVTTKQVLDALEAIFGQDGMQVSLATLPLTDLPSIAFCLRKRGLCHELDTDLLCNLLNGLLVNNDLHGYVRDYSDFRSSSYVLEQDFTGIGYLSNQSSALLFRDLCDITLHDVFFLKDFLAHNFGIKRHCISLIGARSQQTKSHLVWQITAQIHVPNDTNRFENDLSILSISKLEFHLQQGGESSMLVYNARVQDEQSDKFCSNTDNQSRIGLDRQFFALNQGDVDSRRLKAYAVHNFSRSLKSSYKSENIFNEASGPVKKVEFINLALIIKKGIDEFDRANDKFIRDSLHGLVDDIIMKKTQIDKDDIFKYGNSSRKLVLVEGSPGVGKTMLALKLCKDWAEDKILSQYDVVLLVRLRRFRCTASLGFKDLIEIYSEGKNAEELSQILVENCGERTLLILEGWDELPPELRQNPSLFMDIVTGYKLPEASVLVTSRPTVSASLYDYMLERRIEVLGFQRHEIVEYVKENIQEAELLLTHFKKFPNLQALAHIPLTLSIMCSVVRKDNTLPSTLTELYEKYICQVLFVAMMKKDPSLYSGLNHISDISDANVVGMIKTLGKVALDGFKEKCFLFTPNVFGSHMLSGKLVDGLNLLTSFDIPATAGRSKVYQFIHLSVQEFLAAYHMKELPVADQISFLKEYRSDLQFQNVWRFLAGITKLKNKDIRDCIVNGTRQSNQSQLFLIHCLYEAHDQEICSLAAAELKAILDLSNTSLNTADCLCAAYVVSTAGGQWTIDLRGCNVGDDGLNVFKECLIAQQDEHDCYAVDFSIKELNLAHNQLTPDAAVVLADMLKHDIALQKIDLGSNHKFGDAGVEILCEILDHNKTMTALHFLRCNLSPLSGKRLAKMLGSNSTLKDLFVGFENSLRDEGVVPIAQVLSTNKTLTELTLTDTGLTTDSLLELEKSLITNSTLEVIRLARNKLEIKDCEVIGRILSVTTNLTIIDMSKNLIGDEGFGIILDALVLRPECPLLGLGVFGCGITAKGLPKLVDFFKLTNTFKSIQMGFNNLRDEGAKIIGEALLANSSHSLTRVLLQHTEISIRAKEDLEVIRQSLHRPPDNELVIRYDKFHLT